MSRWLRMILGLGTGRHRRSRYEDLHDDSALDIIEQLDRELHDD